jgi:hypothetical protein
MSDYLGHVAQRASTTMPDVMPRVGALFEPVHDAIRMPTEIAVDEATESSQGQHTPWQPHSMDDRLREVRATLSAAPVPTESAQHGRFSLQHGPQPEALIRPAAPLARSQPDISTPRLSSEAISPEVLIAPRLQLLRDAAAGHSNAQTTSGARAPNGEPAESKSQRLMVSPASRSTARPAAPQLPRTVRIEIGRIEIRAVASPTRAQTPRPAARPKQSLEEYLQQRSSPTR